ncbi:MAG: serine hydrolase domain-containing protein [Ilumatobacteraceae bacterium]
MRLRCWDVGRRAALIGLFAMVASACGQARFAAPPPPEFTSGERAEPTLVADTVAPHAETAEFLLDSLAGDAEDVNVDQMTMVDDAGVLSPNVSGWQRFDDTLSNRMIPADVSVSVAVMIDGQIVHSAAFGGRVALDSEPTETTDRFRIASISKTITAITTLRLVDRGVLTLDDSVGAILIQHLGLTTFDPDVDSITVRELLSHTAGFPQHEGTFFSNGANSCADAAIKGLSVDVSSGNGFRYSNMSYCVLGILIEAVTGKNYERVVDEELLGPLGITGMRLTSTYDLGPDEVSHHPSPNRNFMETLGAAGAWNATPSDLVRIINSVDPSTAGWKALSPETIGIVRYRVPNGGPPSGYGLGIINYDGGAWGHTGTIERAHSMVLVQPDGVTWAISVSGDYPGNTPQLRSIVRDALANGFPAA